MRDGANSILVDPSFWRLGAGWHLLRRAWSEASPVVNSGATELEGSTANIGNGFPAEVKLEVIHGSTMSSLPGCST